MKIFSSLRHFCKDKKNGIAKRVNSLCNAVFLYLCSVQLQRQNCHFAKPLQGNFALVAAAFPKRKNRPFSGRFSHFYPCAILRRFSPVFRLPTPKKRHSNAIYRKKQLFPASSSPRSHSSCNLTPGPGGSAPPFGRYKNPREGPVPAGDGI